MNFIIRWWISLNKANVLSLSPGQIFTSGDISVLHIHEGGIYQVREWRRNVWTGQCYWQVTAHLTKQEISDVG